MSEQTIVWDLALIQKYNYSGPRYTSYPTALEFNQGYDEAAFQRAATRYPERPLSLYVHIPFCHKLCYFCGCNKLVTRQTHKADEYLAVLEREIIARAPCLPAVRSANCIGAAVRQPISISSKSAAWSPCYASTLISSQKWRCRSKLTRVKSSWTCWTTCVPKASTALAWGAGLQ